MSESLDKQSQRWWLNELRWGGFGSVAGLGGCILITFDAYYAATNNSSFMQTLEIAAIVEILSFLYPWIVMKRSVSKELIINNQKGIQRMFKIRNWLAFYFLIVAIVSIILFFIVQR